MRRTVNGEPVSDHQIDLIVDEMSAALALSSADTLLDICCGNGALSTRFFDQCAGGLGVDYSQTLIDVANKHFATPDVTYVEGEAVAYLKAAEQPERYTKALLYGSFNFFPAAPAEELLGVVDSTSPYALTGAIFAKDRRVVRQATDALENAAGNFYINDKPTGAVVGQQPFGGGRASGTNDKAGSVLNLIRWVSPRTIKETFDPPKDFRYPFMQ